jgi:YjbE family integral membrane protein
MTLEDLLKIAQIILIDIVLSGDNAVVIAMAAHKLPENQRKTAIWWGGGIAIGMRIAFTAIMALLLMLPGVRLIGGIVLVWIACKLLVDEGDDEHDLGAGKARRSTWAAIRMIFVADFVMSLDNMLAVAGAAGEEWWMVVMGLLVSIGIIMFCSSLIAGWMNRFPVIVYLGVAILAYTAGEMMIRDRELAGYFARTHHVSLDAEWEEQFMLTDEQVKNFNAAELPDDLAAVVKVHGKELEFIGQMTEPQRDELLSRVESQEDQAAIREMYDLSRQREVPDWVPADLRPRVENWFQRKWPADVWKAVQGGQLHFVSWIWRFVVIGFCMSSPYWWRSRKPDQPEPNAKPASGPQAPPSPSA